MTITFFILALLMVCSGIGVVALRNPMHSALNLVVNLLSVAGIFATLDAHFLATVQIIVYAGAIVVLVLFVLMLLNVKTEAPSGRDTALTVISVLMGICFMAVAVPLVATLFVGFPEGSYKEANVGSVVNVGRILYSRYVFTFEAASVLIMAALAGAVMLAKRRYRSEKAS